jgi:hypothetical protein
MLNGAPAHRAVIEKRSHGLARPFQNVLGCLRVIAPLQPSIDPCQFLSHNVLW